MTFVIVSVFCSLAIFFLLSYDRFRQSPEERYFPWLRSRIPIVIKTPWIQRLREVYGAWFLMRYPAGQRWVFIALAISYLFLVLSGFVFAFIGVRLFGMFLLLHVVLGALFAVSLCLAVVLRARYYVWHEEDGAAANLKTREGKKKMWQVILFWIFALSGLVLVAAALGQMLPSFSLRAQLSLFEVHRYAALGIFLAGIAYWYFSYMDEGR